MRMLAIIAALVLAACGAETKPGGGLLGKALAGNEPKKPQQESPPADYVEPNWAFFYGPERASEEGLRRAAQGIVERAARDYTNPARMNLVGTVVRLDDRLLVALAIRGDRYKPSSKLIEDWSVPAAGTLEIRFAERERSQGFRLQDDLPEIRGAQWIRTPFGKPLLVLDEPVLRREDLVFSALTEHQPLLACVPSERAARRIEAGKLSSDRHEPCLMLDGTLSIGDGFAWEPVIVGGDSGDGKALRPRFTFNGRLGLAVAHPVPFSLKAVAKPDQLAARFLRLIQAARSDPLEFNEAARRFVIPEESTWFARSFGPANGDALRRSYYEKAGGPVTALRESVRTNVARGRQECDVVSYRDNHPERPGLWDKIKPGRENPLAEFHSIEMANVFQQNAGSCLVYYFAVVDGEWRYVGSLDR